MVQIFELDAQAILITLEELSDFDQSRFLSEIDVLQLDYEGPSKERVPPPQSHD